jgi:hypothetical protein
MKNLFVSTQGLAIIFLAGAASAAILEIPYTGGKQSGAVEISTSSGDPGSGNLGFRTHPDTVRIGGLTVRLYTGAELALTVCGFKPPTVAIFDAPFGSVRQSPDKSAEWSRFAGHPDSTIALDSVTGYQGYGTSARRVGQGFNLYKAGERNTCMGAEYSMEPDWNRIVFLRFGSGVDYRAKVSFQVKRDTVFGFNPQYQILKSITLHYVLNANSNDLSGPVAIRPARSRGATRQGLQVPYDVYNPLGIRLKREPGRFAPGVRAPR